MCGISGYYLEKNSLIKLNSELNYSLDLISHRGPDDRGTYISSNEKIGLAHSRLSIIDVSENGHQPMHSEDNRLTIIFNGEIYNYKELRDFLYKNGYEKWDGDSDTEVILKLFLYSLKNGMEIEKILLRLKGIFSIALWDSLEKELFLIRDALGIKPLYFSETDLGIFFASEIKGMIPFLNKISSPKNNLSESYLDAENLNRYLTFLWCPGSGTPSKRFKKVGPGEYLKIKYGKIIKKVKWYFLATSNSKTKKLNKFDSINGTYENLKKAVDRQLISDVPIGAFLSGGIDSSSVVAIASQTIPKINCFTIKINGQSEEGFVDDLPYAKKVAHHLNVPLDIVEVESSVLAAGIEEMVWQLDEPLADVAPLNVLLISRLARNKGIKVLLSGSGGDDVFSGYSRHLSLKIDKYWTWLPKNLLLNLEKMTSNIPTERSVFRRLRKVFSGASLNQDERIINYFKWIDNRTLDDLYTDNFLQQLKDVNVELPIMNFLDELPDGLSPLEKMLAVEQKFFLTDHNLIYTDKMSMREGVEVRVPFLDTELLEFASKISDKYKVKGLDCKWVLKKAMEPYLPKDIIYRPKSGFGGPLRHWLRFELYEWLNDILSEERLKNRGIFNHLKVKRLIEQNSEGSIDASYILLSIACIEIWFRHFHDNK
ncbi:asparagine synthase (glutamine-hydrolyzing) [Prochlorococcus marinus XMU1411]|uniref:asparagine synthase (glutamine-hydrolyzing) n=1 Tax=Prochlorococcus marinus TaxID=1219 RepID=UPI001ADB3837|nr:asparagine synthase (glutamine-hydrolyzing) [Prochlorococcus marinus]MBO8244248.1 asparagine synthase (glutamine-hydrolyzing) [Prochlorococcus marinus XMU1411]MBW3055334.1 asparagine synthase (glutamine-hydrolyzing) [Prochlorococcus marinus str. MU1411]MCR8537076.1 asparagine synthase (glutamine-hydrolyzing) [Prochlorococcus marinus CUG1430]